MAQILKFWGLVQWTKILLSQGFIICWLKHWLTFKVWGLNLSFMVRNGWVSYSRQLQYSMGFPVPASSHMMICLFSVLGSLINLCLLFCTTCKFNGVLNNAGTMFFHRWDDHVPCPDRGIRRSRLWWGVKPLGRHKMLTKVRGSSKQQYSLGLAKTLGTI